VKAEIGNILRGSGIPDQPATNYNLFKTTNVSSLIETKWAGSVGPGRV
jgi:hypothetical protein